MHAMAVQLVVGRLGAVDVGEAVLGKEDAEAAVAWEKELAA